MRAEPGIPLHVGDGESIADREQRELRILADHEEISITWSRYAPGERGPEPHVHHRHSDAFYVLDGELTFALGPAGDRIRIAAGGFVAAPPNLVHSFGNEGSADARFVNLHAPDAGFTRSLRARRDGGDPSYDQHDPPADGGRPRAEAIASGPGEGERVVLGNRIAIVKGVLAEMCVTEWTIEGPLAGPHVPQRPQGVDAFYVLEGELAMTVEGAEHTAGPNMIASVPRGVAHGFDHRTSGTTRFLDVHAPDAGFADSLRGIPD
jgi:quercetin dioxygenase-like cupin family protein